VQVLNQFYIKSVVRKALEEDLKPRGDITTNIVSAKNKIIKARIIAKQDGVIAGLEFCKTAFKLIGRETIFTKKVSDGKKIKKNKVIAYIKAKTKTILTAERTALNFLNNEILVLFYGGFLGCLSTFSSFIYQLFVLFKKRKFLRLFFHYIEVIIFSFLFFYLGYFLIQFF